MILHQFCYKKITLTNLLFSSDISTILGLNESGKTFLINNIKNMLFFLKTDTEFITKDVDEISYYITPFVFYLQNNTQILEYHCKFGNFFVYTKHDISLLQNWAKKCVFLDFEKPNIENTITPLEDYITEQISLIGFLEKSKDFETTAYKIYAVLSSLNQVENTTVFIDNFGNSVDFQKSKKLLQILETISKQRKIQVIISSGNRFILNAMSGIENWNILERNPNNSITVYNYLNSKPFFEDFRMTGLNNFDLFQSLV